MKKLLSFSASISVIFILLSIELNLSSCKKETVTVTVHDTTTTTVHDTTTIHDTTTAYPIQGLWTGTASSTTATQDHSPYFFSFSIYSGGMLTYKSIGLDNYTYLAIGTWTLTGTSFTFSVSIVNHPGGIQETQTGNGTYNSTTGTLTGGSITSSLGNTASWTMTRVN